MKLKLAVKILTNIVRKDKSLSEVGLSWAKNTLYDDDDAEYDITITETKISHKSIQILDELLTAYDNVEMLIDFDKEHIRIFETTETPQQ